MELIQVRRLDLLERIETNRNHHRAEFEKAWKGYRNAVVNWFEKRLTELHDGKGLTDTAFRGPVPQDHTEDYDRIIDMMRMEQRDIIEISEREFAMYVRDDWGWKNQFTTSNAAYLP